MSICPCGTGLAYTQCCRLLHEGKAAATAEALMRSRYSAYIMGDAAYIHRSWHSSTRPSKKSLVQPRHIHWQSLEIVRIEAGQLEDQEGRVDFIAYFSEKGQAQQLHELSRFTREKGRWVYLDAVPTTVNPNESGSLSS
ncbi:MAG TPA: YchJ family metal-binding protein [Thiolinea sp.]|nr:YchJ family metal-binding protein [Thiolinea sp.]